MIPCKITIGNHRPTTKGDSPLLVSNIRSWSKQRSLLDNARLRFEHFLREKKKKILILHLESKQKSYTSKIENDSSFGKTTKPLSSKSFRRRWTTGFERERGKKWVENNQGMEINIACSRFSKRGCSEKEREGQGAANRCTACAPFLLDFSKPIERSRSREQHA